MKGHIYKFTIEHVEDSKGNTINTAPLTFTTQNHDDLFKVVEKMKEKLELDENEFK